MSVSKKSFDKQANGIGKRIAFLIDHLKTTQNAFAQEIGLSNNAVISNVIAEKNKPSYETLVAIIYRFDVNPRWLLLEEGPIFANNKHERETVGGMLKWVQEQMMLQDQRHESEKQLLNQTIATYRGLLLKNKIIQV